MRVKRYLDIDVVQAAYERVRYAFDYADVVVVCYSGGKDSEVVKKIAEDVAAERGEQVQVLFRDEELIPSVVIDHVAAQRDRAPERYRWFCIRSRSTKFILGETAPYIQWDPARRHLRPMPPYAITHAPGDDRVFVGNASEAFTVEHFRGKVIYLTGIRAAESLIRHRSCVNKLGPESWIVGSAVPRLSLGKPIYDWQENDVLRFLWERRVRLCPIYLLQHLAGIPLRVSTPLHAETAKRIGALKEVDPVFYDQILDLFPEMALQDRYWGEFKHGRAAADVVYGVSYDGCRAFVAEMADPARRQLAERMLSSALHRAGQHPNAYPPLHVLRWLQSGAFHRECLPLAKTEQAAWARRQEALLAKHAEEEAGV